jgi:hypothetical protein
MDRAAARGSCRGTAATKIDSDMIDSGCRLGSSNICGRLKVFVRSRHTTGLGIHEDVGVTLAAVGILIVWNEAAELFLRAFLVLAVATAGF